MKRSSATTLYALAAAGLLGFSVSASANFSGYYDVPGTWAFANSNGGNGTYISGTPDSITVIGSDVIGSGSGAEFASQTSFTITAGSAGQVSFDWIYVTHDVGDPPVPSAFYDPAGYILNGSSITRTDLSGPVSQSGSVLFTVVAGDVFGFFVNSIDNKGGAAEITVTNFRAPELPTLPPSPSVPEPCSVALLALGLVGVAASRKRRLI